MFSKTIQPAIDEKNMLISCILHSLFTFCLVKNLGGGNRA